MCVKSVFTWVASSGLACALVLGGLHPAAGQTTKNSKEVRRLSLVIGGGVRIAQGVSVGKIEDVVLNDQGCIDYVVVVYRDKYVAIPWTLAVVDYGQRIVTVDITEERFGQVPTFTRTEFSVLSKSDFTQKVHNAFEGKGESKAESKDKPKAESKDEPKAESKDESKAESKDEPKDKPKAESKDEPKAEAKPKAEPKDKPKAEPKDKPKDQPRDKPKAESKEKPKGPLGKLKGN